MAANALRNRPPLGLVRDFVVESEGEHANTLDLKLNGSTPFVDAARVFALATGAEATGTAARPARASQGSGLATQHSPRPAALSYSLTLLFSFSLSEPER